jgi:SAM-dependent methyltransferase
MGAGAGRFTQELAKTTSQIVVADISPGQLALNRQHAAEHGFTDNVEAWIECDMCDLESTFDANTFAQLRRVTKPGGKVLFGVMSLWGTVHQYLPGVLDVDIPSNREIVATGNLTEKTVGPGRHYNHMYRSDELHSVLEHGGLEILTLSASNCLATNWAEPLSSLAEDSLEWMHLIEMEIEACQEPGCRDMRTHMIAVCRKPV